MCVRRSRNDNGGMDGTGGDGALTPRAAAPIARATQNAMRAFGAGARSPRAAAFSPRSWCACTRLRSLRRKAREFSPRTPGAALFFKASDTHA
eukprot:1430776-Prymnesium_polylepis.3